MPEPWVAVQLFQYSTSATEGWDQGKWDQGHWDGGLGPTNWTDITCDVRTVIIKRGKQNVTVLGGVEAGTLDIDLDNRDGKWSQLTPLPGGAVAPALSAGVIIRVISTTDPTGVNVTHHFLGWVESWRQEWTNDDDVVHLTAHDAWSDLVQQGQGIPWSPGLSGDQIAYRLVALLVRGGWPNIHGQVQPKRTLMRPVFLQPGTIYCIGGRPVPSGGTFVEIGLTVSTSVADEITKTAVSDGGKAFIDADGSFVYLNRHWALPGTIPALASYSPSGLTRPAQALVAGAMPLFGDWCPPGPTANELPYTQLEWEYDAKNPAGAVVVANTAPPEIRNAAGVMFPQPWKQVGASLVNPEGTPVLTLTDLRFGGNPATGGAEASALVTHYFNAYANAYIAVRRLQVYPALDDRLWTVALNLRIGDHINVLRREPGTTLQMEVAIEGLTLTITPDPRRADKVNNRYYGSWLYDFTTSEARSLVTSTSFSDDFERANGSVGSNWLLGISTSSWVGSVVPFTIASGAAVGYRQASGESALSYMVWHEPQPVNQAIEVELTGGLWTADHSYPDGYAELYTNANRTNSACERVTFNFSFDPAGPYIYVNVQPLNADGTTTAWSADASPFVGTAADLPPTGWPVEPVRLRLESDPDGTQRVYVNSTLVLTAVDPAPKVGSYVGMALNPTQPAASPRVLSAIGGTAVHSMRRDYASTG